MSETENLKKITIKKLTGFALASLPVAHAFFTREGGCGSPPYAGLNTAFKTDDPDAELNRKLLFDSVGIEKNRIVILSPNHGNEIFFADNENYDDSIVRMGTDAGFTNRKGRYFLVSSADCIILAIGDKSFSFAGVIHLGWRNLVSDFCGQAIKEASAHYKIDPAEFVVGIGPCIYPCCYIFENPVQKSRDARFWEPFLYHEKDDLYAIDLVSAVKKKLVNAGVLKANIHETNLCTGCNNHLFFSCYKEGYVSGRFPNLVGFERFGLWKNRLGIL
ncbi:polyphenol oxidase family protein [Desulfobacterales bacterium HSG16]|nr:polyphenol oxidase family protein [Desulfobacterales bacterium HSG16]